MTGGIPHAFEEAFKQKRSVLGERIDVSNKLLNLLFDKDVISKEHKQDCEKGTDYDRVDKLMNILVKRPDHCFPLFCDALIEDGQGHVINLMNTVSLAGSPSHQQQSGVRFQPVFNAPNPVPVNPQTQFYTAGSYAQYPGNPPFQANYTSSSPYGNQGFVQGNQPQFWSAGGVPYGTNVPPMTHLTGSMAAPYNGTPGYQHKNVAASTPNLATPAGGTSGHSTSRPAAQTHRTTSIPATAQVQSNQSSINQTGSATSASGAQASSSQTTPAAASSITLFIPANLMLVPWSELTNIDAIYSGGFGVINVASHAQYGTVVYKELATKVINVKDKNAREMQREALAHSLRHKNIIQTIGAVFETGHYGILLEYAKYGALDDFVNNYPVEFMMKMFLARGVVRGLHYLHTLTSPVAHGYLKVQHVLVAGGYVAKICDFGLSKWKTFATTRTMSRSQRGTVTHIPPENFENVNLKPTLQFDIYSLGILLWQLLTGQQPFEDLITNPETVKLAVKSNERPSLGDLDKIAGQIPDDVRSEMKRLISDCWAREPDKRPSAEALKADFRKIMADKEELIKKAKANLDKEIIAAETETLKLQ